MMQILQLSRFGIDGKQQIQKSFRSGSVFKHLCESDYRILAIDVGVYGKESEDVIFRNSNLSKILKAGELCSINDF